MSKLGINGFGRIGRLVLRRLLEVDSSLEVVAINDLTSPKVLAYLLKHDSNYGPFPWSVDFTEDALIVNGKTITVYAEKEAQHIPWQAAGAEVIVECTGFYTSAEKSQAHLQAGARKVLISAPAGEMKTIVYNVNDDTLTPDDTIISVASCTTNCLAPMAKGQQRRVKANHQRRLKTTAEKADYDDNLFGETSEGIVISRFG
ncbi:glyceraldehyde 3-phosphate dehydrogenase NAD-binding domain-containing protein, partial [Klebsiella pneumoniae]